MPFIPHTDTDVREMLAAIGAPSIDALFEEIPAALRIKSLAGIPEALTEMEVGRLMQQRAARDGRPLNFLGAGAYEHHIPAAVWAIVTRGEFYSAYTPYQAEASQGLQRLGAAFGMQPAGGDHVAADGADGFFVLQGGGDAAFILVDDQAHGIGADIDDRNRFLIAHVSGLQRSRRKRGCGVANSSGTCPSSTGRIRLAA